MQASREGGWIRTWEDVKEGNSHLGQVVLADPGNIQGFAEDDQNYLMITKIKSGEPCVTYAGFASTLSRDFHTQEEWAKYVGDFQTRMRSPVEIKLEKASR
jgi:hypothetical protein